MAYTNSSLISLTKISPNRNAPRNHKIDTVSIHCYVGQASIESAANYFAKSSTQASCNYYIGTDGRIALIVPESDRSWCTSSPSNDNRAITIECASDRIHPYKVNDKVFNALIILLADICKRNDIKELKWEADKNLIGQVDKQNMTVHRWFKNKSCPGNYLYDRHGEIARQVNEKLNPPKNTTTVSKTPQAQWFGIVNVKSGSTLTVRKGAGTNNEKLFSLNRNAEVLVYSSKTDKNGDKWYYISYNGKFGYVHSDYITKMTFVSGGYDYSLVFNPIYYVEKYPDLMKAFGYNGKKLFSHFLSHGAKEGRKAISSFDVNVYKKNYADLQKAYKNNLPSYYKHYIKYGRKEGRKAV